jgi:hypothetical protein
MNANNNNGDHNEHDYDFADGDAQLTRISLFVDPQKRRRDRKIFAAACIALAAAAGLVWLWINVLFPVFFPEPAGSWELIGLSGISGLSEEEIAAHLERSSEYWYFFSDGTALVTSIYDGIPKEEFLGQTDRLLSVDDRERLEHFYYTYVAGPHMHTVDFTWTARPLRRKLTMNGELEPYDRRRHGQREYRRIPHRRQRLCLHYDFQAHNRR